MCTLILGLFGWFLNINAVRREVERTFWCYYLFNCVFPGLSERNEFIFNKVPAEECSYR